MNPSRKIYNFTSIMSRRKQSNPKPLLKRDDEEFENALSLNTQNSMKEDSKDGNKSPLNNEQLIVNSDSETEMLSNDEEKTPFENDPEENCQSPPTLPTLRLNIALASDPACNPEAKEINNISIKSEILKNLDSDENEMTEPININDADNEISIAKILCDENQKSLALPKAKENISNVSNLIVKNLDLIRPNVFMCTPCGIRFSSLSTLEAHCTYYCSHRKTDENLLKNASSSDLNGIEPPAKSIKTGKQYACSQCSYSADKKVSLNRHMRMHQTSPTPSSTTSNGEEGSNQIAIPQIITPVITQTIVDRYCSDCDIRFSSTKTYRAHKQHYCSSRHQSLTSSIVPPALTNSTAAKPPKSGTQTPETPKTPPASSQPFIALPTNPVIIIPYSLIRNASIIPGPLSSIAPGTNPESACFLFQNGTLQPIAYILSHVSSPNLNPQSHAQQSSKSSVTSQNTSNPEPKIIARPSSSGSGEVLKSINKRDCVTSRETTTPLDLSIRRISSNSTNIRERSLSFSSAVSVDHFRIEFDAMMEGKENISISGDSTTPEQIVCAPSLPSLPGSPPLTPSPKRRSKSPRSSVSISPNSSSSQQPLLMRPLLPSDIALRLSDPALNVMSPLVKQSMEIALRMTNSGSSGAADVTQQQVSPSQVIKSSNSMSTIPTSMSPQVIVKTGMSKCKECNIVFCKYENYLAHKKHYCSARNLEESGNGAKISPPPVATHASVPQTYQQLICMACGVKFASRDNLNAHQTYYCPKRNDLDAQTSANTSQKEKCIKCKTLHDSSQNCIATAQGSTVYKCPICEVVSPNSNEARKHIETHGGVKAFRCTICRYKGNTLRGMRTHIRMHIDRKSGDFNEENFISCILENTEILPSKNSAKFTGTIENETNVTKLDENEVRTKQLNDIIEETTKTIKKEPHDENFLHEEITNDETSLIPENIISVKSENQHHSDRKTSPNNENFSSDRKRRSSLDSQKHCDNCEIVFTYEHSLQAHRKFYCKGDKSTPPNSNVVNIPVAEAPALLLK